MLNKYLGVDANNTPHCTHMLFVYYTCAYLESMYKHLYLYVYYSVYIGVYFEFFLF